MLTSIEADSVEDAVYALASPENDEFFPVDSKDIELRGNGWYMSGDVSLFDVADPMTAKNVLDIVRNRIDDGECIRLENVR